MRPARSGVHETPAHPDERDDLLDITEIHFATVMEAIPGFVWSSEPDGTLEFCNQRWLDYTGLTLDQVRAGGLGEAIHPEDKSDFHKKCRAALTQGISFEAGLRMRRHDGSYLWFVIRAEPQRDAGGQIIR